MPSLLPLLGLAVLSGGGNDDLAGRWISPTGNVTIAMAPCGSNGAAWCGTVVEASAEAIADTRRASGRNLIGMTLVREMKSVGANHWRGTVVIPDRKQSVRGALRLVGSSLEVKGCAARVICKRQRWRRVN